MPSPSTSKSESKSESTSPASEPGAPAVKVPIKAPIKAPITARVLGALKRAGRRPGWLRLSLALGLVIGLLWWIFVFRHQADAGPGAQRSKQGFASPGVPGAPGQAAVDARLDVTLPGGLPGAGYPVASKDLQPGHAAFVARAASAEPAPAQTWDLCDLGRMPRTPEALRAANSAQSSSAGAVAAESMGAAPAPEQGIPPHLLRDPLDAAKRRLLAQLSQSAPRQRAVALLLVDVDAAAAQDAAASAPVQAAAPPRVANLGAQLAALARAAPQDAALAAIAAAHCQKSGDCAGFDGAAWLRADPTNAAAWWAWHQHQPKQTEALMRGMASATRWSSESSVILEVVLGAIPVDSPRYLQLELLRWGMNPVWQMPLLPMRGLNEMCNPGSALAQPGRRAFCDHVAKLMVQQGDALITARVGLKQGQRLGWPSERLSRLRAEVDAGRDFLLGPPVPADQPLSCAAHEALFTWARSYAQHGELGAARRSAAPASMGSRPSSR